VSLPLQAVIQSQGDIMEGVSKRHKEVSEADRVREEKGSPWTEASAEQIVDLENRL
jgi:hypothetical protein